MNNRVVVFLLLTLFFQTLQSKEIQYPDDITLTNKIPEIAREDYEETSLRRAEIVFIVSLPFTAALSFLVGNIFYFVTDMNYDFKMTHLSPEILPFSIVSALFTSGMITYGDYLIVQKKKEEQNNQVEKSEEIHELKFNFGLEKKF